MLESTIKVHGRTGNLTVNDDIIKIFLTTSKGIYGEGWTILRKPEIEIGVPIYIGGSQYTRLDQAFVNAVSQGRTVESDVVNAYKVQKIVDTIYSSAANQGQLQSIDYID